MHNSKLSSAYLKQGSWKEKRTTSYEQDIEEKGQTYTRENNEHLQKAVHDHLINIKLQITKLFGLIYEILVLIASTSSKSSDEPALMCSLARAFDALIHKIWKRKDQIFLFVWFDSLRPGQQFFSYVGTGLPGLDHNLARINVSCLRTQHSDTGIAQTRNPLVLSQALYHWALRSLRRIRAQGYEKK